MTDVHRLPVQRDQDGATSQTTTAEAAGASHGSFVAATVFPV